MRMQAVYSNVTHKVPPPKIKIQRRLPPPPIALSPVSMNLWRNRQTIPEVQMSKSQKSCLALAWHIMTLIKAFGFDEIIHAP